ncbi:hypothetical protein [Psychrobacillus soli]|uniref:SbsC C-terminal domain-containing protein n=1 Tax=Psychrobacillus soli TaxID=1543965 RepID=A0A544TL12_9BACI|nr:hypothetical protein [Psychrobacillus soli]TQR18151.1 hypothetical protein FG383_03095 [Psychrobacillus soli]
MKKVIKIAASTAVAASAFVAAAPANQADAAVNVNQLATDAQNAGTVLKWAISVEGSADFVTRPYDQFNAAKKAVAAAEAAAKKLSTSEKLSLDAKLVDAKLQIKRAAAYIDAITSSEKIKDLTSKLDAAIASGDIEKVEAAYHTATAEYRKQAKLLDRVYGQTTRDEIRNAVKPAIEKSVASVKNEVTVNMLVKAAAKDVAAGKIADAHAKIAEAQAIIDANNLKWEADLQKSVNDSKTDLPAIPGNISVETAAFHGETNQTYAVVASVKTTSGAAYNGVVEVSFDKAGYKFVKVNGTTVDTSDVTTADVVNGQLVMTVTNSTTDVPVAGGKIKIATKSANGSTIDTQNTGTLNFYKKVDSAVLNVNDNSGKVKYVDVANNYFVNENLEKIVLSATGNVYQDTNNAVISLDAFKAKLTKGDIVTGTYYKSIGSTLQLALDYQEGSKFELKQEVVEDTAYRVEGNTVTLSGTGEAGKRVAIYKTENADVVANGTAALTVVTVGSNGLWSTTLSVPTKTTFAAYQIPSVNDLAPAYSFELGEEITVVNGKFEAEAAFNGGYATDDSLTGDVFLFTSTKDTKELKISSNAQVTLVDGDTTRATYVNGVNGTKIEKVDGTGFKITFGTPSTITGGKLEGALTVSNVSGIENAYGLKANVKGFVSGY